MSSPASTDGALPRLHSPQEIADALGVSEWWVKNEARKRRIPCVKVAGSYRFTAQHLAEIVAEFEQRPEASRTETTTPRRRQQEHGEAPTAQLQARRPRRSPSPTKR